jgi:hypothetical protein
MRSISLHPAFAAALLAVVLFLAGCSGAGTAASNLDERLLGEWVAEGGARYTITAERGAYRIGIVDTDGEVFEVREVTWTDGVLAWTYFVPSTSYTVSERTVRISAESLDVAWQNQTGASGQETFARP